ncbi:hypothetical protein BDN72DRAFT_132694 [Pluteus cervinus]|uniref:Uncharacterized protein n=1 Tax=Pluteus cervinus TaxID=181527 RepID=A0ACD3AL81_9AGAR|nr:hypothetical protein BDN72DRAFT_132694 [Pluteus cervinus]
MKGVASNSKQRACCLTFLSLSSTSPYHPPKPSSPILHLCFRLPPSSSLFIFYAPPFCRYRAREVPPICGTSLYGYMHFIFNLHVCTYLPTDGLYSHLLQYLLFYGYGLLRICIPTA